MIQHYEVGDIVKFANDVFTIYDIVVKANSATVAFHEFSLEKHKTMAKRKLSNCNKWDLKDKDGTRVYDLWKIISK